MSMAEGVGFEPTEAFTSHAFQACRFGRSRTLPYLFTSGFPLEDLFTSGREASDR